MADYRPFIVRRTSGGDVLREDDPAFWLAALRFGARVVTPEEVEGTALVTRPFFYHGAVVTVKVPQSVDWEQAVLVRGGFGAPTTPQDGIVVWYSDDKPTGMDLDGNPIHLSQEVVDQPLTPPNWYYYSLFLWVGNQWVWVAREEVLVPKNHGWSDVLFEAIPPFYQRTDNELAADGRNGALRQFTNVLGYDLDYTQCWADGVMNVYAMDRAPMKLLNLLGSNMGFPREQVLGGNRFRSVLEQLDDLNSLRGTRLGLERLILAASDYRCDVRQGNNDLLAVDDGDFHGDGGVPEIDPLTLPSAEQMRWGIGHWEAMVDTFYLDKIKDPTDSDISAFDAATSPAIIARNTVPGPSSILTPPGGRGAMVINGPGPQTVVSCGHISHPYAVIPGALTSGVPVTPGALYEFSVETIRTGWGPSGEQPPQARVILGIFWWTDTAWPILCDTGPDVPDNYDAATWQRTTIQAFAPENYDDDPLMNAVFATPVIWWKHASAWAGYATDIHTMPLFGRYISMANFGRVQVVGGDVVPVSPDVYLTLGVDSKKLAGPSSRLGEP